MSSTGGDSSAPFAARGVASVQCWCDGTPNSTLEQTAGSHSLAASAQRERSANLRWAPTETWTGP